MHSFTDLSITWVECVSDFPHSDSVGFLDKNYKTIAPMFTKSLLLETVCQFSGLFNAIRTVPSDLLLAGFSSWRVKSHEEVLQILCSSSL